MTTEFSDKINRCAEVVRNALIHLPDGTELDSHDVCDYVDLYLKKNPKYKKIIKHDITPRCVAKYIKASGLVELEPIVPGGNKVFKAPRKIYTIHHQESDIACPEDTNGSTLS